METRRIIQSIHNEWKCTCVYVCASPTFNLDSWGVGSGGLLPPSPPVLAEALGLWDEGAQRVFLEPVRVFEGEPLSILPLGEHQFHYIHFLTALESRGLRFEATAFLQCQKKNKKPSGKPANSVQHSRRIESLKTGGGEATSNQNTAERLTAGPSDTDRNSDTAGVSFK